jgi:hypothetical protein
MADEAADGHKAESAQARPDSPSVDPGPIEFDVVLKDIVPKNDAPITLIIDLDDVIDQSE